MGFFLSIMAFLSYSSCLDWQGGGNWTIDNLTTIRTKINTFSPSSLANYDPFSLSPSNQLNATWNVFLIYQGDRYNHDAVLYGYGFNEHYFLFNGLQASTGYVSFIIWKDYNCVQWITFNSLNGPAVSFTSTLYAPISSTIKFGYANRNINEIWKEAQDIQEKVPTVDSSLLKNKLAYTVIINQYSTNCLFGRFCAKDYITSVKGQ